MKNSKIKYLKRIEEIKIHLGLQLNRAVNAVKLERVFAKHACVDGHNEGVGVLSNYPLRLSHLLYGARNGQVKIWRLSNKKCLGIVQAHNGPVSGISVDSSVGEIFTTIGQDSQLKHWIDFVIAGESNFVWKLYRDSPVRTYDFGPNTIHSIRCRPVKASVMAGMLVFEFT
uniref:Uncharacterized protein n=1 Tax=Panagrolaimus davidi TaxID=227884 RepID=A0A914PM52_9BILA